MIIPHDSTSSMFREAARKVRSPVDVVVDVGAGIRPQNLIKARKHVCVEPHGEYADALEKSGYTVIRETGLAALRRFDKFVDAIVALDVIEHMDRDEGEAFVEEAKRLATQVVVMTPLGFVDQDGGGAKDAWGLNGQTWQKHRSGWEPRDFPGWDLVVDHGFHVKLKRGAFFAIWTS